MGLSALSQFNKSQGVGDWSVSKYEDLLRSQGLDIEEMSKILNAPISSNRTVIACAGSGKTTTMCHVIVADYLRGVTKTDEIINGTLVHASKPVTVLTFLKKAQLDMESRFENIRSELPFGFPLRPRFSTFHSDYYDLIRQHTGVAPQIINENVNSSLLKKAVLAMGHNKQVGTDLIDPDLIQPSDWSNLEAGLFLIRDSRPEEFSLRGMRSFFQAYSSMDEGFNAKLRGILSEGITHENIESVTAQISEIVTPIVRKMLFEWKKLRAGRSRGGATGRVYKDFHDLQDEVFDLLGAGDIKNADPKFLNLIKHRYSVLYIDEFQDISTIQYFITKSIMDICKGTLMIVGDDDQAIYSWRGGDVSAMVVRAPKDFDMERFYLSKNWRCPDKILDPIKSSIEKNPDTARIKKNIQAAKEGGEVGAITFQNTLDQAVRLVDMVRDDNDKGMRVAVLARKNNTLILPALTIIYNNPGKKVDFVKTSSTKVISSYTAVQQLVNFIAGQTGQVFNEEGISVLKQLFYYGELNSLRNELVKGKNIDNLQLVDSNFGKGGDSSDSSKDSKLRQLVETGQAAMKNLEYETSYLKVMLEKVQDIANSKKYCSDALKQVISFFIEVLKDSIEKETSDTKCLHRFASEIDRVWNAIHTDVVYPHITFSTVHSFKGRESDSVYLLSDTTKEFNPEDSTESVVEMRKVHYIAGTRAKKKMVYCISGSDPASIFFQEMDKVPEYSPDIKITL